MPRLFLRIAAAAFLILITIQPHPTAHAQGNVSVTAEVDRTAATTDDLITLTVVVAGGFEQLGQPQLPMLSGFDVVNGRRSSQFSMVNGVVISRATFSYQLRPTGSGKQTIDPIVIQVNGSTYHTKPILIELTERTVSQPDGQPEYGQTPDENPEVDPSIPASPSGLAGQDFFVETDVDNLSPYVGQQIIYRFRLYQAVDLLGQPRLGWPAFSGFWSESLTPNRMFEQEAAGRHYRVTEVRRALFPTSSGQVRIEPAELTIPGESFSRDTVLRSTPVAVNVRPLPEGAPDGFTGAVGQFEISAWVAPEQASLNEATTLYIRVAGTGNLATLPDPSADAENLLTNWRAYETQITTTVDQDGDIIRGEKVFERLLVPKLSGDLVIPSLHLAFFDTEAGSYRHISSDAIEIPITPAIDAAPGVAETDGGEQGVIVHRGDVRHIKAAPPSLSAGHTRLLEQPAYWLAWIVPLVAVFSVWTWERRQRRLSSDTAYIRAQNAKRRARKRLTTAGQLVGKDDVAAHAVVARIIYDYLGDILDLPPPGLTRDAIRCGLSAKSVPDDVIDRTSRCLDWVDSGQFAPSAAGTNAEELIAEIESVIGELEKTARSQ